MGNIKPGESGNVDAMISGIAPTMDDGKIKLTITYEDENGVVTPVEKEIQLMVTEPMVFDEPDIDMGNVDEMEDDQSFLGKYQPYLVPAGILAVVVIAAVAAMIRRRKKKAGMDDEIL